MRYCCCRYCWQGSKAQERTEEKTNGADDKQAETDDRFECSCRRVERFQRKRARVRGENRIRQKQVRSDLNQVIAQK